MIQTISNLLSKKDKNLKEKQEARHIPKPIITEYQNKNIDTDQFHNQLTLQKNNPQIEAMLYDIFLLTSQIKDPEFPQTLGQLKVIKEENIHYDPLTKLFTILWTPTVKHCHLAQQIGLSIITKLQQELMDFDQYKFEIIIENGTHNEKEQLDKQINDKERVLAAQENKELMKFIESLINYQQN